MKTIFALWFALCLSAGAALPGPAWLASATKAAAGGGGTCTYISGMSYSNVNDQAGGGYITSQAVSNTIGAIQICEVHWYIYGASGQSNYCQIRSTYNGGGTQYGGNSSTNQVSATGVYTYTFATPVSVSGDFWITLQNFGVNNINMPVNNAQIYKVNYPYYTDDTLRAWAPCWQIYIVQ